MNNNLIDQYLIELLRIPAEQRTQENIAETINRIGSAAQLDASPLSQIHQEHAKLVAIVEFLAAELGIQRHDTSLWIREGHTQSLSAILSDAEGQYLMGFGETAEEVLKDLHTVARNKDAA
ncbi:hypothetical protein [Pseudomonas sp. RT6P73]